LVGVAVDGGLVLATYRQTQNADAAALAAVELFHGQSTATAMTTASNHVQTYNSTANAVTWTPWRSWTTRHRPIVESRLQGRGRSGSWALPVV
jgi:hypothetical protein